MAELLKFQVEAKKKMFILTFSKLHSINTGPKISRYLAQCNGALNANAVGTRRLGIHNGPGLFWQLFS